MSSGARSASQAHRQVQVGSPLGDDALLFTRMIATEGLSDLYRIELDLLSHDTGIRPDAILGGGVTVAWKWDPDGPTRYWTGVAIRFGLIGGDAGLARYRCELAPPLWLLSQNRNSRIFEEMSVRDIVSAVLGEYGLNAQTLEGLEEVLEYCVQYEESDYAFLCRLMERHGAYFYHEHANAETKLHVVKADHAHAALPWHQPVEVREPGESLSMGLEYFDDWRHEGRVRPDKATFQDYDFKKPRADLEGVRTIAGWQHAKEFETYSYATGHADTGAGTKLAEIHARSTRADAVTYQGRGNARALSPGFLFDVIGDRAELNEHRELLAVRTTAMLEMGGYESGDGGGVTFEAGVEAVPKTVPWQAPKTTPWPRILGPQTAVVDNENGEELDVDEWGRVRLSFHWERQGTRSMRARVSQLWAGAQWGAAAWPRHGQEVIVEHLNGDPDRPIVTGRVYNDSARPPHDPVRDASIFSIKSRSTPGGGGFNALEFQDKAGEEHVFVHSQKDTHLRTTEKLFERIGTEEHRVTVEDSRSEYRADRHATVAGDDLLKVQGALHVDVTDDVHLRSGANIAQAAQQNVHIKGGMNVVIEAGMQITLKVGGSFITIGSAGVDITGPMVKINSGGSAGSGTAASPSPAVLPDEPMEGAPGAEAPATRTRDWNAVRQRLQANPSAAVMLAAAKSGAPFCEVCERAKREREAKNAGSGGGSGGGSSSSRRSGGETG